MAHVFKPISSHSLEEILEFLYGELNQKAFLQTDPIGVVHEFAHSRDQEVMALMGSLLAYGRASQIRNSLQNLLQALSCSPAQGGQPGDLAHLVEKLLDIRSFNKTQKLLSNFVHRFNTGNDIVILLRLLCRTWKEYGSLESHFEFYYRDQEHVVEETLHRVVKDWKIWAAEWKAPRSFYYLLTDPHDGSVCKRWNMFLRWVVRNDEVDLGLWKGKIKASHLYIPLDTHMARISQQLGFRTRKSLNWKCAVEVTAAFKRISPQDPVKYDFALTRLGVLDWLDKGSHQAMKDLVLHKGTLLSRLPQERL